jgi:hypothetical protein
MRRRSVRSFLILVVIVFVGIQFVPVERSNPPINPAETVERKVNVPPAVRVVLNRSCKNCHSNETAWPAYSYVAPTSWLLVHDVNAAREEMNFSEWGQYDSDSARDILVEICRQVRKGAMPLRQYTLIHPSARLTATDVETLCAWTVDVRKALPASE